VAREQHPRDVGFDEPDLIDLMAVALGIRERLDE
jgi:hypothetical protein